MLLVDGQPFKLTKELEDRHRSKIRIMVPLNKVRRNKAMENRIEPSAGQGVLSHYSTYLDGKQVTVRYFENSQWDDSIKREIYTPEHIMIPDKGWIDIENSPELVWFLRNHPGWSAHPDRESKDGISRPRIDFTVMEQFRILDLHQNVKQVFGKKDKLMKLMEASDKWTFNDMIGICHVLSYSQDATFRLPYQIMEYRSVEEKDAEALRAALIEVCANEPVFVYDKIYASRQSDISSAVHNLSFGEKPLLVFNGSTRVWELNEGKKDPLKLYTVPVKDDPHTFLVKSATKDKDIGDKLLRMSANQKETV